MQTESASSAIKAPPANRFANFDNVMLADAMGDIATELKALKQREDDARAEMTRRKQTSIEGARFTIVKAVKVSFRFNADAAKTKMGKAWYDALKKKVFSTTYTVIAKPAAEAAAASAAEALARKAGA